MEVIASGAYTTEALLAHESGADFVKIFPADQLGPQYLRNLLAPMPQSRLVPTGGVTVANADTFIHAGSMALGIGSALVNKVILSRRDWNALTQTARAFGDAVEKARR